MKHILKIALLTTALVATPALAKDVVKKEETTTTKEVTTKDGTTTKTVRHHHHKHMTTTDSNSYYGHRYDGGTFLGYPIQANGNPEDLRRSRTIQR